MSRAGLFRLAAAAALAPLARSLPATAAPTPVRFTFKVPGFVGGPDALRHALMHPGEYALTERHCRELVAKANRQRAAWDANSAALQTKHEAQIIRLATEL